MCLLSLDGKTNIIAKLNFIAVQQIRYDIKVH